MGHSNRHFVLTKIVRNFRFLMAAFLTAMLIAGIAHTDVHQTADVDRNGTNLLVHAQDVGPDNHDAVESSHDASCPSQSFCHNQQMLSAETLGSRQPLFKSFRLPMPDPSFGSSQMVALDIRPPIA